MNEELTLQDIVMKCVCKSGTEEQDLIDNYDRQCRRHRVVALYGQLKTALINLKKQGKIVIKERNGKKLCFKL